MKLILIFIVMDLVTLLAYPVVFVYGRLHKLTNAGRTSPLPA